jgi:hypothetical protein
LLSNEMWQLQVAGLFAFHLWCEMKCEQSQFANSWLPVCLPSLMSNEMWTITNCWLLITCLLSISDVWWNVNNLWLKTSGCLFDLYLWCQLKCYQSIHAAFWMPV